MVNTQIADVYKNQQIMTASKEQLTLLLYNGALRFINESIQAQEQGDVSKSHNANLKAQNIVREFMVTLDQSYEISKQWLQLYEFVEHSLIQGNIKKDVTHLQNAKGIMEEMRDAWHEVMKQGKMAQSGVSNG